MRSLYICGIFVFLFASCSFKKQHDNQGIASNRSSVIHKKDDTADEPQNDSAKHIMMQQSQMDRPISLLEIEKYDERVSLKHLKRIPVTYADVYKIRTQQSVYHPDTKKIQLDVINVNGPIAGPAYHRMEQWYNGKWVEFPFVDNLSFTGIGQELHKGKVLSEDIYMSEFKNSLKPNKYKIHFYVYANIYTYCTLTEDAILPVENSILKGAFEFRALRSTNDSIRILFANHTNLRVQPVFLPSVGTDEFYSVHPFARSGWSGEHKWMETHASIDAGEGVVFSIPVSWDTSCLQKSADSERFMSGKLSPGKYKLGLGIEVYMSTEFIVK